MSEARMKPTDWSLLIRFGAFLAPYRRPVITALSLVPLVTVLSLLQPYLLKIGIDDYILANNLDGLDTLAMGLIALVLGSYFLNGVQSYLLQVAVVHAIGDLRKSLYNHVMRQSSRFFDRHSSGALLTRSTSDVESLGEIVSMGMLGMFADALMISGILIAMLILDVKLTLLTFCLAPLVVFIVNVCRRKLREYGLAIRESLSRLNGYLAEHLAGYSVIRAFGRAETSLEEFKVLNYRYLNAYKKSNWYDASLYAVMDGISNICIALMLWYGGMRLLDGDTGLSLGLLVAFIEYTSRLFVPVRDLSGKVATLQRAVAALEKIFGLLDDRDEVEQGTIRIAPDTPFKMEMKGVRFRYRDTLPEVLQGIDLTLAPGKSVALVGRTGSGKSTIGRLLTKTYTGYTGSIRLADGKTELADVQIDSIRSLVSVIHQDVFLFAGTIHDNIAMGLNNPTEERVREAARWVGADSMIEALPGGYGFKIQERGQNLSAGQAQLIAFARAIARNAPLLILDEATSNVDPAMELAIQKAVDRIVAHKTVLIVAHRLSTIEAVDEILVLDEGQVVERGTHRNLSVAGGPYQALLESAEGDQ